MQIFQSTHPHGVRLQTFPSKMLPGLFQSTHPHGVRHTDKIIIGDSFAFQSTHPHGVRLHRTDSDKRRIRFQSTHPHGVRPQLVIADIPYNLDFNPRTRTGCDFCIQELRASNCNFNPRTRTGCDVRHKLKIRFNRRFQSTHPHGVRPRKLSFYLQTKTFQSTHPHGVRLKRIGKYEDLPVISIHAPARGATAFECTACASQVDFNPRTRTGCDGKDSLGASNFALFQSTHPHGVRLACQ